MAFIENSTSSKNQEAPPLLPMLLSNKYPSPLIMLDDISLLSFEFEYGSERPGDDGPLLETKLGGPLHPKPVSVDKIIGQYKSYCR